MYKLTLTAAVIGLLAACGVNKNNFDDKFAESLCKAVRECSEAYFNSYWSSLDDCEEEYSDYYSESTIEDCDFDNKQARECLKAVDDYARSCDYRDIEGVDACAEIYDCG